MPSKPNSCPPSGTRVAQILFVVSGVFGVGCVGEVGEETEQAPDDVEVVEEALSGAGCGDILMAGLYDEVKFSSQSSDTYALSKSFCQEQSKKGSGGGSTSFDYGPIGGVLSAHASKESWSKYCSHFALATTADETINLRTRTVNADVVQAWAQCVTQKGGLACYHLPGEPQIGITYDEIANTGELHNVTLTPTNMKLVDPKQVKNVSPTLYIGDSLLTFSVPKPSENASLAITGRTKDNYAQSCSVLIASQAKINAELKAAWNKLAADYEPIVAWATKKLAGTSNPDTFNYVARVAPFLKAAKAELDNARAQAANCTPSSTSCRMLTGARFSIGGTYPKVTCHHVFDSNSERTQTSPSKEFHYNVLDFKLTDDGPAEWLDAFSEMDPYLRNCQAR